jgi:hypothetical protein
VDEIEPLNALRQSNREKLQALQMQGVALEGSTVVMLRLNSFIEFMQVRLQLTDEDIQTFEIGFETAIAEILDAGTQQANRTRLLAPLQQPPSGGIISPNGRPT